MKFKSVLGLILCAIVMVKAQHYSPTYSLLAGYSGHAPAPGVIHDPTATNPRHLAHKAVVENAAIESELPQELINPFYKNPNIAAGLAKESWFGDKEFPVFHRQADKIPRSEIAKIIKRIEHSERR